ncbi:MAG: sulfotransferase, partial [Planctomycetia bacterium]|nr:sulfotransferase [Planctomycetia bacterium]
EDGIKGLQEMGYDREHVRNKLRQLAAYFLQGYAVSRQKKRIVEKTPHYVACLDFIEELFGPQCQYLMLYRHPLDVVVSMTKHFTIGWHPLLRRYVEHESDPHVGYARFWADHVAKMQDFEAAHPDRCKRVRYEDVVAQPAERLRSLIEFINEPWSDDVLKYYQHQHDLGRGDRKALLQKGIVPSVDNWRSLDSALLEKVQAIVQGPAAQLGYAFETPASRERGQPTANLAGASTGGNGW